MNKWRFAWLFPVALAVLLGGLSAWLETISDVKIEEVALNPNEPQYAMVGLAGKRFAADGSLQENLRAESAWQLPNSKEVVLEQPRLDVFKTGALVYDVKSAQATYDTNTREVAFVQQVVLNKAADGNQPAGEVKTERLLVNSREQSAKSDETVYFRYGQSHGSAQGFRYQHQQGLLIFPAKVKATIYDPKNPS
ncbi:MAG: LPS export ABC transporter periplasmic protein LptC [Neisseria sp.]|nr:LPS export ABC transporter periplasmic protein LptC [Neisseria sp.]